MKTVFRKLTMTTTYALRGKVMNWSVLFINYNTGNFCAYNIFDNPEFRLNIEKLFETQCDKETFIKQLQREAHYSFWAKVEWEIIIDARRKIDIYAQLCANWERFTDYMWSEYQKHLKGDN